MCIVIAKRKGAKYDLDTAIQMCINGFNNNNQGCGLALKRKDDTKIFIYKTMSINEFINQLISLQVKDEDELILHFRISTSGKIDVKNCHPFIISKKQSYLRVVEGFIEKPVMAHNGVFYDYDDFKSVMNDSYHFAAQFLTNKTNYEFLTTNLSKLKRKQIQSFIGWSRIAIMHPTKDMVIIGDSLVTDVRHPGWIFSNNGYMSFASYALPKEAKKEKKRPIGFKVFKSKSSSNYLKASYEENKNRNTSGTLFNDEEEIYNHLEQEGEWAGII